MTARLTFIAITAFWVTMNGLLWHQEFGAHADAVPVPFDLVWEKILTAPDASSLTIYQSRARMGYCEFFTSVGQQLAELDDDKLPSTALAARAGYQVHLSGNFAFGAFTNQIKFTGQLRFNQQREWRELTLKIASRQTTVELHSLATKQILHLKITDDGAVMERDLTFAELQNPNTLLHAFLGDAGDPFPSGMELPTLAPAAAAQKISWHASRTRVRIGAETVPVYHLETGALGYNMTVDVSTLGEILRIELPGNLTARINGWNKP